MTRAGDRAETSPVTLNRHEGYPKNQVRRWDAEYSLSEAMMMKTNIHVSQKRDAWILCCKPSIILAYGVHAV